MQPGERPLSGQLFINREIILVFHDPGLLVFVSFLAHSFF